MSIKCPRCTSSNPESARFCLDCGTKLKSSDKVDVSHTKTLETPFKEFTRGTVLADRYEIIEELGQGGMGRVYRVEDKKVHEEVALKLIRPDIVADMITIDRFRSELKIARKIRHKHICGMYDLGEDKGTHFITMEYIPGEDLKTLIRRVRRLDVSTSISLSKQICDGLTEAHRLGIIHRDLKPNNIMIDKSGQARIMDFGIARFVKGRDVTQAGAMIGTPEYMSPEQVEGKKADERSDIYSFGVILYEMVTGTLPFTGETPLSIAMQQKNELPQEPKKFNPQVHDRLNQLILTCLEKNRGDRYQSVRDIALELDKIEKTLSSRDKTILQGAPGKELPVKKKWKHSLAVLPFEDLSPQKDQDYFCDGLAEELINALTKIEDIRVVARTSSFAFKGEKLDIREIGKKLDVETILEGSVRKAGQRLRITAQLIDIKGGHHLWSERFDRDLEDVFEVQDEITSNIVDKLKTELVIPSHIQKERHSDSLEAYDLYLKGRYYWNKSSPEKLEKIISYFDRAIEKDPKYALAYVALAEAYTTLSIGFAMLPSKEAMPKVKQAALTALQLDPTLAEAHVALALFSTCYEWDRKAANRNFKQAIELNPNYAGAYQWIEIYLTFLEGKFGEAIAALERAQELDPFNLYIKIRLGFMQLYTYDYDRAIEQFKKIVELEPGFALGHLSLGTAYTWKSQLEKGLDEVKMAIQLGGRAVVNISTLGMIYGMMGKKDETEKLLDEVIERSVKGYVSSFWVGMIYLAMGEDDKGFEWLYKAYAERDSSLIYITVVPPLDPFRDDPRFQNLLKKMGLSNMIDKQALIREYRQSIK